MVLRSTKCRFRRYKTRKLIILWKAIATLFAVGRHDAFYLMLPYENKETTKGTKEKLGRKC
jgi:hypothetical protein